MTTLFDVGDEIEVTLRGKIKAYSIEEVGGDCYTIVLEDPNLMHNTRGTYVYLDSEALKNAKKVN